MKIHVLWLIGSFPRVSGQLDEEYVSSCQIFFLILDVLGCFVLDKMSEDMCISFTISLMSVKYQIDPMFGKITQMTMRRLQK